MPTHDREAEFKAQVEALNVVIDQQKAKLIERANQLCRLEHDLRNSRLAVTGYRDIAEETERELQRLRVVAEEALRENALLKDDIRRAAEGYRELPLHPAPVDLFAPAVREDEIPPYTQTK